MSRPAPPSRPTDVTVLIRVFLAVLFVQELVVGVWNQVLPRSFYDHFPTVNLTPPYSEHFARDFGGATLGIAIILAIALARPRPEFVVPAALAFSAFAVPHFFFHVVHLDGANTAQKVFLVAGNAIVALLGLATIALSVASRRTTVSV